MSYENVGQIALVIIADFAIMHCRAALGSSRHDESGYHRAEYIGDERTIRLHRRQRTARAGTKANERSTRHHSDRSS